MSAKHINGQAGIKYVMTEFSKKSPTHFNGHYKESWKRKIKVIYNIARFPKEYLYWYIIETPEEKGRSFTKFWREYVLFRTTEDKVNQ